MAKKKKVRARKGPPDDYKAALDLSAFSPAGGLWGYRGDLSEWEALFGREAVPQALPEPRGDRDADATTRS